MTDGAVTTKARVSKGASLVSDRTPRRIRGAVPRSASRFPRISKALLSPAGVLVGAAVGVGVARASIRRWPVGEEPPPASAETVGEVAVGRDGAGLIVVANVAAGNALSPSPTSRLRSLLPAAEIVEVEPSDDLEAAFGRAAASAVVLGVAGGDGTASTAARVAARAGVPLALVSAGTLNHLAGDLGVEDLRSTAQAVREGRTIAIDLGDLNGRAFIKAVGLGGYHQLVAERERREGYLGKWPALAVAFASVLARGEPLEVEVDGRRRRVWWLFLGCGSFLGDGLVPARRRRLDEGCIEVRLVDAERAWSRLRLLASAMVGRIGRSKVYERWSTERVVLRSYDGPVGVVCDGEVISAPAELTVGIRPRALRVLQPAHVQG